MIIVFTNEDLIPAWREKNLPLESIMAGMVLHDVRETCFNKAKEVYFTRGDGRFICFKFETIYTKEVGKVTVGLPIRNR